MMKSVKYLILLVALCVGGQMFAKSFGDELKEFNTTKYDHKADWLNFVQEKVTQTTKLEKSQAKDWANFKNKHIGNFIKAKNMSDDAKELFFRNKLNEAVNLAKKHMNDCEKLARDFAEKAQKLFVKHRDHIAKFEADLIENHPPRTETATE